MAQKTPADKPLGCCFTTSGLRANSAHRQRRESGLALCITGSLAARSNFWTEKNLVVVSKNYCGVFLGEVGKSSWATRRVVHQLFPTFRRIVQNNPQFILGGSGGNGTDLSRSSVKSVTWVWAEMQSDETPRILDPCFTDPGGFPPHFWSLAGIISDYFIMTNPLSQCLSGLGVFYTNAESHTFCI